MSPNARLTLADSRYYSDQTFQIQVALLMIAAFISLRQSLPEVAAQIPNNHRMSFCQRRT